MTRKGCEASKLLAWLRDILKGADAVNVDIFVEEESESRSTVHITLHDIPGPLAGLELRPPSDE